jgi:hypothetical protein
VALLAFAVFALVLQAKIVLNVTFLHYGFALAAPALVLVVWCATVALPDAVARSGGSASVAAWIAAGLVVALGAAHVSRQVEVWSLYETALGAPPDEMRVGPGRGRVLASVVEEIRERTAPGQSVAVFPEGVMLNYLARRPLAVPYFTFTPFDLVVTPEAEILAAFAASPPDLVVLVHRETREYGLPFFGRSYGRSLNTWVRRNYRPVRMIGDPPLRQGSDFGALVMERQP